MGNPSELLNSQRDYKSMRLCVDLDGVVVQYDFPKIVKDFFGVDLLSKDIFAYDLADVLGVAPALINDMFKEQVFGKPNLVEGAIDTLREWQSKSWEIIIYSNRVKYMSYKVLEEWLFFYGIPFTDIDGGKGEYDYHIDDSPSKHMENNNRVKLLYDQPWNKRCLNITGELIRVSDWARIRDIIK